MMDSEKPVTQIARASGASLSLLYSWRKALKKDEDHALPGNGKQTESSIALAKQELREGAIHHSDRGSQYASTDHRARLNEAGLTIARGATLRSMTSLSILSRLKKPLDFVSTIARGPQSQRDDLKKKPPSFEGGR